MVQTWSKKKILIFSLSAGTQNNSKAFFDLVCGICREVVKVCHKNYLFKQSDLTRHSTWNSSMCCWNGCCFCAFLLASFISNIKLNLLHVCLQLTMHVVQPIALKGFFFLLLLISSGIYSLCSSV